MPTCVVYGQCMVNLWRDNVVNVMARYGQDYWIVEVSKGRYMLSIREKISNTCCVYMLSIREKISNTCCV